MKFSFKQKLALTIIVTGIATGAQAQQTGQPSGQPSVPYKTHPCMSEHQNVVATCKADPCTPACKEAHKQLKACRIANNIPEHPHPQSTGPKKPGCPTTSATPQAPGNATPPPAGAP